VLSYFASERLVRTAYLSVTRGDGGQNLIGNEAGPLLGLIRTHELLQARRIDGAEQFFTRAIDFGYSKNPEETLQTWGHDAVLADVVWAIRRFQPDVIVTRFPTNGDGGHGHHTASAILAEEAFAAAADPTKFPEQLYFVSPWQAKRIFWNRFSFRPVDPKRSRAREIAPRRPRHIQPLLRTRVHGDRGRAAASTRARASARPSAAARSQLSRSTRRRRRGEDPLEGIDTAGRVIRVARRSARFSTKRPRRST
jgi:LmbE family N-acetylglucosaminyl deacetylase